MKLLTDRLFIQPLSEKDVAFIYELLNSEGWIKYIGNRDFNSLVDAKAYIQKNNAVQDISYWSVSLIQSNETIGLITLIKRDYLDLKDIGFAFLPSFLRERLRLRSYRSSHALLS